MADVRIIYVDEFEEAAPTRCPLCADPIERIVVTNTQCAGSSTLAAGVPGCWKSENGKWSARPA